MIVKSIIKNLNKRVFSTWYTKTHEYIKVNNNLWTIGLSEFATNSIGDICFVELPKIGTHVEKDDLIINIDSIKAVFEINSPISGQIIYINNNVEKLPIIINNSPLDKGWLVKIKTDECITNHAFLSENEYNNFIKDL